MLRRLFGGGADDPGAPDRGGDPLASVDSTLARLETGRDTFAIFDAGDGHYVQVSIGDTGLYGEAVSNAYLKGIERLGDDAIETLGTMGWVAVGDANFSRTWDRWTGDDRAQVVDDIVGTLRLVYEMPPDGPLDITVGH